MKVFCNSCSIHFLDDFASTNRAPCNFWGDMGMGNVDVSYKRKVWEWMFAMPADEIAVRYGISMQLSVGGKAIAEKDKIENKIPGYLTMTQEQKIEAQRQYFGLQATTTDKLLTTPRHKAD